MNLIKEELSLFEALAKLYPESSKSTFQKWIKFGRVLVDSVAMKHGNERVYQGQKVEVKKKSTYKEANGLKILFEDRHMVVIEKPLNILSVASDNPEEVHALALLQEAYKTRSIHAVHRLDQKTTGVLLFARGKESEKRFDDLFERHELTRKYFGILEGTLLKKNGTWECYLREKENFDVEVTTPGNGKLAITHYKVLHTSKQFSYVIFELETGRKHQIRVQSKEAGHPLLGDLRYGALSNPLGRLALHAFHLEFIHPFTGKVMKFTSPLPKAFSKVMPNTLDIPKEWS